MRAAKRVLGLFVLGLALVLAPSAGQAQAREARFAEALSYLDGDAGLILSVRPPQLQALQERWVETLPQQKGASDLAALAAIAILGFHPLQTRAWQAIGIDTEARILIQLAAIDRQATIAADRGGPSALWRTRILLPVADRDLAVKAISNMRLRDRVRVSEPNQGLAKLLDLGSGTSERVQRKLGKAGVFMLGRPAPMDGLIIASARDSLIIIDWIAPYGPGAQRFRWSKHEAMIMAAIARRPRVLGSRPHIDVLAEDELALWIEPVALGTALAAAEVDGLPRTSVLRRHRRCEPFRSLAKESAFTALAAGLRSDDSAIDFNARWFLREGEPLLSLLRTEKLAHLRGNDPLLRVQMHLGHVGSLHKRPRSPVAASWDLLWNKAKACGRGSKVFALAVAWPEIAGLFLDELSALDASAAQVVGALGPVSLSVLGQGETRSEEDPTGESGDETVDGEIKSVRVNAEAWLRKPGDAAAKRWLATLFGRELRKRSSTSFGSGSLQPYAIDQGRGSIIGAGLRPGSRAWALSTSRLPDASSSRDSLLSIAARPALLAEQLPELPWLEALRGFARADGALLTEPEALHLRLHLDESEDARVGDPNP